MVTQQDEPIVSPVGDANDEPADRGNDDEALRDEIIRLRVEVSSLRDDAVREWLAVADAESRILGQVYNTFSWKVTSPIRAVRRFQIAARQRGIVNASRDAADFAARRLGRRR